MITDTASSGVTPLHRESEGLWDRVFMDAPVPGDVEATLTGGQILADEFGNAAQQKQAIAAGGSPAGTALAQGTSVAAKDVVGVAGGVLNFTKWLADNLGMVILLVVAGAFVILYAGEGK